MKSTDAQNVSQQRRTNVQDTKNSFVVFYRVERGLLQKLSGGVGPPFLRGVPNHTGLSTEAPRTGAGLLTAVPC